MILTKEHNKGFLNIAFAYTCKYIKNKIYYTLYTINNYKLKYQHYS